MLLATSYPACRWWQRFYLIRVGLAKRIWRNATFIYQLLRYEGAILGAGTAQTKHLAHIRLISKTTTTKTSSHQPSLGLMSYLPIPIIDRLTGWLIIDCKLIGCWIYWLMDGWMDGLFIYLPIDWFISWFNNLSDWKIDWFIKWFSY